MKNKIVLISLVAGYLVLGPMLAHLVSAQTAVTMSYSRANNSTVDLDANKQFTIGVMINTGGANSGGFDATLKYDVSKITYVSNSYASFYDGQTLPPLNTVSGANSLLKIGRSSADPFGAPAHSTSATLASTITFQVATTGLDPATLSWNYTAGSTADNTNVWTPNASGEMLTSAPGNVTLNFNAYVPPVVNPDIISISPDHVNEGSAETDVTLTASTDLAKQFGGTKGTVNFDGTALAATKVTSWSATTIHFLAPTRTVTADDPTNVYIVTAETTPRTSDTVVFTYIDVPVTTVNPDIISISPDHVNEGSAETDVTLTASTDLAKQFGGTKGTVNFDGTALAATKVTSWSATTIHFLAPTRTVTADDPTNVYIVTAETTPRTSDTVVFTYIDVSAVNNPNIATIVPSSGTESGGISVTLTGTYFGATEGSVSIGGVTVPAGDVTWTGTNTTTGNTITFVTPAFSVTADTSVSVHIVTAAASGSLTSNLLSYIYTNDAGASVTDPNITYLSPSAGRADTSVVVTINGTNFLPSGHTAGTVTFGTYSAVVISWYDTQIKVTAPTLGAIPGDVTYTVKVTRDDSRFDTDLYTFLSPASTGGGDNDGADDTVPDSGLPMSVWFSLISINTGLAFWAKKKFL